MGESTVPVLSAQQSTSSMPKPATNALDLLGDLFGSAPVVKEVAPPTKVFANVTCYSKNGLNVVITPLKESATVCQFKATFTTTSGDITNINFQVAVPKTLRLAMQPASGTTASPATPVTQLMKIENLTKVPIRLRIKLSYSTGSTGAVDEIVEVSTLDPKLWE